MSGLPDSYRWNDAAEASYLYQNYACRAVVTGSVVKIKRRGGPDVVGACASLEQGKRFVERWLCVADGHYRLGRRWRTCDARPGSAPVGPVAS